MEFIDYIDPKLLILIPVLYILGVFLKNSLIKDKQIPLILCGVSVILAVMWSLSTTGLDSLQTAMSAAFTALVQGILCAGAAVLSNQLYKQAGKDDFQ